MKRFFILALVLTSFGSSPVSAYALTGTPSVTLVVTRYPGQRGNQNQEKAEQKRLEIKQRIEAKRASKSAQLSTLRKETIRSFVTNMTMRMDATIARLEQLASRLETRIAITKQENPTADTTQLEKQLADAKKLLADAKTDLAAAKANVETVLSSQNPREAFSVLRTTLMGVKTKLVQVHTLMVQMVGELRGLRVGYTSGSPRPTRVYGTGTPKPTRAHESESPKPTKVLTPTVTI